MHDHAFFNRIWKDQAKKEEQRYYRNRIREYLEKKR